MPTHITIFFRARTKRCQLQPRVQNEVWERLNNSFNLIYIESHSEPAYSWTVSHRIQLAYSFKHLFLKLSWNDLPPLHVFTFLCCSFVSPISRHQHTSLVFLSKNLLFPHVYTPFQALRVRKPVQRSSWPSRRLTTAYIIIVQSSQRGSHSISIFQNLYRQCKFKATCANFSTAIPNRVPQTYFNKVFLIMFCLHWPSPLRKHTHLPLLYTTIYKSLFSLSSHLPLLSSPISIYSLVQI